MKKYIRQFYGISLLVTVLIITSVFYMFSYMDTYSEEQAQSILKMKSDFLSSRINSHLKIKSQIVNDVVRYIESQETRDDQALTFYLQDLLIENQNLESIYFGYKDNTVISGNVLILPHDLNLSAKNWYKEAAQHGGLILTNLYPSASGGQNVLTIAKPVRNKEGNIIGVVGADLSLNRIVDILIDEKESDVHAFLVDSQEAVMAYSKDFQPTTFNLGEVNPGLLPDYKAASNDAFKTEINGTPGYMFFRKVEDTTLTLATFISLEAFKGHRQQWIAIFSFTILMIILVFIFMFMSHSRLLMKPLLSLDKDIQKIAIGDNIDYRLPFRAKDPFQLIRESANKTLIEAQNFFTDLKENQQELEATNEELIAILEQLGFYEDEINYKNSTFQAIVNAQPDIIFINDGSGNYLDCHANHSNTLVASKEDIIGKNIYDTLPAKHAERILELIQETLRTAELQYYEYQLNFDKTQKTFEARIVKITDNEVLSIIRDITAEKKERELILNLSYKDQLTGIYNRRYFEERSEAINKSEFLPLAMIMIDVNGLKLTNDAFGHLMGDELLKKVASHLNAHCSNDAFVSRIGGDEFIMLLPNTTNEEAQELVSTLYSEINNDNLGNVVISISIGWAVRNSMKQTLKEVFIESEDHMYRRKITEGQSMRNQTIQVIMQTLNEKSEREKRHSDQVSKLSKQIAVAMNLDPQLLGEVETAGLLHDIGKISVRDEVLNKPGKLTNEEYNEIKKHPESSYQILKSVDAYSSLADDALAHHERYDGKGYPKGLKGDEIPLIARIISVADAYEAMVSDRSYRKGIPHAAALEEIVRNSGTQFDPVIVDYFVESFK